METTPTRFEALTTCRDRAGSDSQLARDLDVTQPTVWRWLKQTKQMPPEYCLKAERIYGVPKEYLRPDIYPRDVMVDQAVEDRFCGIDMRAGERREAPRRVA
ncbi:MAG: helix-turn-helix domain-containing protein [Proteobacteria bacterium]|nr:helix-turn-helix domain-containing protein [Pseudomonadota bacterium]